MILVDFGPSNNDDGRATANPDTNGNHWNCWRPKPGEWKIDAGTKLNDLIDVKNKTTSLNLEITEAFTGSNGIQNGGLIAPHGPVASLLKTFAVETATEDYFFTTGKARFKIAGLDLSRKYNFRLFGTRETTIARTTRYTLFGGNGPVTADLITSGNNIGSNGAYDGNDDEIATIGGVVPNSDGEILVEVAAEQGGFGYLGIMEIEAVGK